MGVVIGRWYKSSVSWVLEMTVLTDKSVGGYVLGYKAVYPEYYDPSVRETRKDRWESWMRGGHRQILVQAKSRCSFVTHVVSIVKEMIGYLAMNVADRRSAVSSPEQATPSV